MKIEIQALTKRYGALTAVDEVDAVFESGHLVALLGPSGCGKSTILNMLSGILPVSAGKILFDDRDVTDLPPEKRGVGLVFQNYALYPHMSVLDNICFPLKVRKIPRKERIARATEIAEKVHIETLLRRKPFELSGGQQQRVAVARALVKNPNLLLMDEPLSNLDAKLRVEMREEIRRIQKASGVTTLFVTHDQEEAISISDRVMLLNQGKIQQYNAARELYDHPHNLFVADFIGAPSINQLNGIWRQGRFILRDSELSLPVQAFAVPEGAQTVLAFRAESVQCGGKKDCLQAEVLEKYLSGKDELTLLRVAGQTFRAYLDSGFADAVGDTVSVTLKQRGVFLFDANTGGMYA